MLRSWNFWRRLVEFLDQAITEFIELFVRLGVGVRHHHAKFARPVVSQGEHVHALVLEPGRQLESGRVDVVSGGWRGFHIPVLISKVDLAAAGYIDVHPWIVHVHLPELNLARRYVERDVDVGGQVSVFRFRSNLAVFSRALDRR